MLKFLLLALALNAPAQTFLDPATWQQVPEPLATRDIAYGSDAPKSQILDVYRNASSSTAKASPVLVYIHGGGWNHGNRPATWQPFRPWLAAGFSIVNVEYRLVDVAPAPAAVQDVRCVLSWILRNAATYHFDTTRIVTYGTSSGGHLAMMAAFLPASNDIDPPQCRTQPRVAAVLDFFGPYHLEPTEPGAFTSPSTARWILGTKADAGVQPLLFAKEHALSPSTYVRSGLPPVFIAHGDADPTVPYAASVALQQDLARAGVRNVFDTVPGGGHGQWSAEQTRRVQLDSLHFLAGLGIIP